MRFILRFLPVAALLLCTQDSFAQRIRPIPYPVVENPKFEKAVANGTRTETGEPGANYWMNGADYTIEAELDPTTHILHGSETLTYHNNSPDDLSRLTIHLRQNLHKEGVIRNRPQKLTGGIKIFSVSSDGTEIGERPTGKRAGYSINGTLMQLSLPETLASGESIQISFEWEFKVPDAGAPRIGTDGEIFFVGYWYPQVAVYDDVNGWKADPYMANGEFYMDYGNYDVALTLPEGWIVGATGELVNGAEVLSPQTLTRLEKARQSHDVTHIVTEIDRAPGISTVDSDSGKLTWRFQALNVRDFAFGTSDKYLWDATTAEVGDRDGDDSNDLSMINAFYRPEQTRWARSAEFAQYTIEFLSDMFMPYPWPHMTTVEGVIGGGMEFPMITHIGGARSDQSLFGVTFHEIGHMYFPMIVGQDEKQFTWMDEGLTSFNTSEGSSAFWNSDAWAPERQSYYRIAGTGDEVEPMRHGDRYPLSTAARGIASYNKPAVALNALRGLVGQERFSEAYREYAHRWAFKHPQPYDLFNTFNEVLGEDYDWFWTTMFFNTWTLDQAVAGVKDGPDGVEVTIKDLGLSPFPVPIRVTYDDGAIVDETIPVDVWLSDKREATVRFEAGTVSRVEIDPGKFLPDVDRSNNVWEKK
jgi:Peptidase family M1 domain